jgi:hypothetical protein
MILKIFYISLWILVLQSSSFASLQGYPEEGDYAQYEVDGALRFKCGYQKLQSSLAPFTYIHTLSLGYGNLVTLPDEIGLLTNLKNLTLCENYLKELPETICDLEYQSIDSVARSNRAFNGLKGINTCGKSFNILAQKHWKTDAA